jgi:hypothetical protein
MRADPSVRITDTRSKRAAFSQQKVALFLRLASHHIHEDKLSPPLAIYQSFRPIHLFSLG